jgi:hypothetical protein
MSRKSDMGSDGASLRNVLWSWISVVALLALVIWNIGWTGPLFFKSRDYRLQVYLTANEPIVAGSKIRADQLQAEWNWLTAEKRASVVGVAARAIGRFARQNIDPDKPITREMLSETPSVDPTEAFSVVPVQVKGAFASVLRPGQQLAFVKEGTFRPIDFTDAGGVKAFLLRAIAPCDTPTTEVTLFIEVPMGELGDIRSLTDGTWTPVVLPQKPKAPSPP